MFIQHFLSSSGLPMRFQSDTPADCERMARTVHGVVTPRFRLAIRSAREVVGLATDVVWFIASLVMLKAVMALLAIFQWQGIAQ